MDDIHNWHRKEAFALAVLICFKVWTKYLVTCMYDVKRISAHAQSRC